VYGKGEIGKSPGFPSGGTSNGQKKRKKKYEEREGQWDLRGKKPKVEKLTEPSKRANRGGAEKKVELLSEKKRGGLLCRGCGHSKVMPGG